jgi:hypothetical protein
MYAGTGISTDSARRKKARRTARWMAKQCRKLFQAKAMPELQSPAWELPFATAPVPTFANGSVETESGPFTVVR